MIPLIDYLISWLDRFQSRWAVRIENVQGVLYRQKHELERLEELLGRRPPMYVPPWRRMMYDRLLSAQALDDILQDFVDRRGVSNEPVSGETVKWRRYGPLQSMVKPLSEGEYP